MAGDKTANRQCHTICACAMLGNWHHNNNIMAEQQQLELDELGPTCTVESLGNGKSDPKPDGGRASDLRRRRVNVDPSAAESGADGATDIDSVQSEEGWTADGGRAGNVRKKIESAAIEDEYDTGILDRRRSQTQAAGREAKRPGDEATRSPLRIQPDSSERPHINLCQVRYHYLIILYIDTLPIHLTLGLGRTLCIGGICLNTGVI